MRTTFLITTATCCVAACGGDSQTRRLSIEQLGVTVEVPSNPHDIDFVHEGDEATETGELRRVDITVPDLRMCRISIFPKGEELTFDQRIESASLELFGTERELSRWHHKEQTSDGWLLDYEVTENGRKIRVVTQRRVVDGRTFTCESGRILVDDDAQRCAEVVAHACGSLQSTAG